VLVALEVIALFANDAGAVVADERSFFTTEGCFLMVVSLSFAFDAMLIGTGIAFFIDMPFAALRLPESFFPAFKMRSSSSSFALSSFSWFSRPDSTFMYLRHCLARATISGQGSLVINTPIMSVSL
jgi:hypothetical protein